MDRRPLVLLLAMLDAGERYEALHPETLTLGLPPPGWCVPDDLFIPAPYPLNPGWMGEGLEEEEARLVSFAPQWAAVMVRCALSTVGRGWRACLCTDAQHLPLHRMGAAWPSVVRLHALS